MVRKKRSGPVRGVQLVEEVIEHVRAHDLLTAPKPLPRRVLDRLRFSTGAELSPALKRWLAFDAEWIGLFDDLARPKLRGYKVSELVERELGSWGNAFEKEVDPLLPGTCYLLPIGTDSRRFLYVGEPDDAGEHPVFWVDTDDVPALGLDAPGIDGYLAKTFGVWPQGGEYGSVPAAYRRAMDKQADLNFGGRRSYELGEPQGGADVEWFDTYVFGDIRVADPNAWKGVPIKLAAPALPKLLQAPPRRASVNDALKAIADCREHVVQLEWISGALSLRGIISEVAIRSGVLASIVTVLCGLAQARAKGNVTLYVCQGKADVSAYGLKLASGRLELETLGSPRDVLRKSRKEIDHVNRLVAEGSPSKVAV